MMDSPECEDCMKRAWGHYWASDFEATMKEVAELLTLDPTDSDGWWLKGLCHIQLGQLPQAESCCTEALRLRQLNRGHSKTSVEHSNEGIHFDTWTPPSSQHIKVGDALHTRGLYPDIKTKAYKQAIQEYNKAIAIDPFNPDGWKKKGWCRFRLRDFEASMKDFTTYLFLKPEDDGEWNTKGNCYHNLGRYPEAVECYTKAVNLNPDRDFYWWNRMLSHTANSELPLALQDLHQAIALNPEVHRYWDKKGEIHQELGEFSEARKAYECASELKLSSDKEAL
eukprot:Protomagalhaensia_wolfi_Nauph_80__6058@NODE_846_length_1949_cov_53_053927_g636_i0_p1_GENE_NODE_846_length_1949_cov_53_053927_g636_i0NODE_846_length_1949_cov_53_053927_g636_i0_p1_ORF_typecomplete_len281_score39_96TPR_16/PF13432_6/9_3e05TPR_16/PF13432_6/5_2e07TPR_16/PF13432_6/9_9e08TPR_16/PF13432_6/1_1e06TPR_16/PF13432_6/3_7e06TPR_1/PF00515_28/0_0013TPR_1/PF00515_28/0_0044TPR_1/PF00515_28/9_9TPR_1/PF00515_28/6_4e12TPR_1/PF00515_28/5_1TPR_1/PF00515_28/0_075TPR_9/PF13371_6/6_4e05TPR_9/PF13371_6/9_8e